MPVAPGSFRTMVGRLDRSFLSLGGVGTRPRFQDFDCMDVPPSSSFVPLFSFPNSLGFAVLNRLILRSRLHVGPR